MRPILFFRCNAIKLGRILPVAWAIIVAIMLVAGWQSGISVCALLVNVMVGSIGPAFIFTVIAAIRGWWHFRLADYIQQKKPGEVVLHFSGCCSTLKLCNGFCVMVVFINFNRLLYNYYPLETGV